MNEVSVKKNWASMAIVASCAAAVLAACGGGSDNVVYWPGVTSTPIPTGSVTPSVTPTPTGSVTPTGGPTPTGVPSANDCSPAVPSNGQVIKQAFSGVDGQAQASGFFPIGNAVASYTFNNGSYTTSSSVASYYPMASGTYDVGSGAILTDVAPVVPLPADVNDLTAYDSFVGYYPSDWAQQLAKKLGDKNVGDTETLDVTLEASGKLPGLLAAVLAKTASDKNVLRMHVTVTATRLANGTVNGVDNACKFSYTMYRPFLADTNTVLQPNPNAETRPVIHTTAAAEQAAMAVVEMLSPGVPDGIASIDYPTRLALEVYLPAIEGTFATSKLVPFFPVELKMKHVYGVSSDAFPTYTFSDGQQAVEKALPPAQPPATQTYTYAP